MSLRAGPKGPTSPLTRKQYRETLKSFSGRYANRDRCLFILGIRTGFRISELLSIRVGSVFQHGRLVERVTVERRNMKSGEEARAVALHPEAREALATWLEELGTEDPGRFLFQSRQRPRHPISYGQARRVLQDAFRVAGLAGIYATHSMRKTFAEWSHKAFGGDLLKTQRALGHASIQSTIHYLQADREEIDAAIVGIE